MTGLFSFVVMDEQKVIEDQEANDMARNKLWFDGFIFFFMFIDIVITLYVRFSLPGRTCAGEFLL